MKTVLAAMGLALFANADLAVNNKAILPPLDPTTHSNASQWCANIEAYPGDPSSTVRGYCYNNGVTYISHLDLNQCLTNSNGVVSSMENGNAMQSCTLGENGRNACENCGAAIFNIDCKATDSARPNVTDRVDLDDFVGVQQSNVVLQGEAVAVWVLSCTTGVNSLGEFEECTIDGAEAQTCYN